MKILEIASFFPPLGGSFVLDQAKALQSEGAEVAIIACNRLGVSMGVEQYIFSRHGIWTEEEEVTVFRSNMRDFPRSTAWNLHRWLKRVRTMYDIYCGKYGRPDIIHAQCGIWAGVAAMRIAQEENLPYFVTEHIPVELFEREFGAGWTRQLWIKSLLQEVYRQARCVIHVAEEQFDWLSPYLGQNYRHQYISNVIDTNFFAYRRREQANSPRIGCLAVADIHRKGYDVLAEAWSKMDGCQLFLAGRGTDGKAMRELFKGNRQVHLMGELDKEGVRSLLYNCDLLVLPSRSEVQPLVLLEAMCTGIPVVTTDAVTHNVQIPDACFVAKVGDALSLAEQIRLALSHGPLSAQKTEEIRQMVSPPTIAHQLESLFKS